MAIDSLQDKIRKLKNPTVIDFTMKQEHIPANIAEEEADFCSAYLRYCRELMSALKELVPAVRFSFTAFAMMDGGVAGLKQLMNEAKELGYYVLLDGLDFSTPVAAELIAESVFAGEAWPCDGIVVPAYLGSDCIKPFLEDCKNKKKDLFVQAKTSNKSAPELQDLRTGSRQVHTAAMDLINRYGEPIVGKFGYSYVAAIVGAAAPDNIRTMRSKYQRVFFMTDGYDYPNGNAKNCSFAFDRMGHGAVACAGTSVTAAWQFNESDGSDFVEQAVEAALRMKKNLTRYVTIL